MYNLPRGIPFLGEAPIKLTIKNYVDAEAFYEPNYNSQEDYAAWALHYLTYFSEKHQSALYLYMNRQGMSLSKAESILNKLPK